jgi:hypothetical protein
MPSAQSDLRSRASSSSASGRRLLPLQHGVVRIGHHRACRHEAVVDALDTLADVATNFGRRDEHARATFDRGVDKGEEILAELREVVLVTPLEDPDSGHGKLPRDGHEAARWRT